MSIFDTLFGDNSTTSETKTALTGPATQTATNLFNTANNYANQPYSQFGGPTVAGFNPTQESAFNAANAISNDTNGLYADLVARVNAGLGVHDSANRTVDMISGRQDALANMGVTSALDLAKQFPDVDISRYMSPYVQQVLDPAIRDLEESAEKNRQQLIGRSAMTGSFGGSRNALAQAEAQQGTEEEIARLSANERARAYTAATEQFRADQTAIPALFQAGMGFNSQAMDQFMKGDNFRRLGYQDQANLLAANAGRLNTQVSPLLTVGGLQQGRDQAQIDSDISNFNTQRDWGARGLDALIRSLGVGPGVTGQTTRSTVTPPSPNPVGQVLGAVGGITGALGGLGPIAGAVGGAANWIGNQASSWFSPAEGFTNTVPEVIDVASGLAKFGPGFKRGGLVHFAAV